MSTMTYLKNMIKDRHIASITPTSSKGVRKICSRIDFDQDNVIVEYGPGTGVFTEYLLQQSTAGSRLVLIERNANFVSILRKRFRDPRVFIFHDSAENIATILDSCGIGQADYILSGIPFSLMSHDLRELIVRETYLSLRSQGKFLPYQTFFQKDRHLKDHMSAHFNRVHDEFFILNAPPMRIYEGVK